MIRKIIACAAVTSMLFSGQILLAAKKETVAVVQTELGEIVWRFFPRQAPGHSAYVQELISKGFYDGTTFHRVIPHFVAQGGDPNSKNADRADDGAGRADKTLTAEFSGALHYRPGTVGMARDEDPDSGSCQFFIALENIPRLEMKYTIFGEVISGLDVARKIADLPRDRNDNPIQPVPVKIRLEQRAVPEKILSLEPSEVTGEVNTGGGRRPKPLDPKNVLWKLPVLKDGQRSAASARLDLVIDADGKVTDVRFCGLDAPEPRQLQAAALAWTFEPALYEGKPQKVRCEIGASGENVGAPTADGMPREVGEGISTPTPVVRIEVTAGTKAPETAPRMRLTIDAAGSVLDAALQQSCGDTSLDAIALYEARRLAFAPATRLVPGEKEPEPVPVYLDVTARFVEPAK